jgi:hypothetical protein
LQTRIVAGSTVVEEPCDSSVIETEEDQRGKCSLFLGDLSLFCTEADIEDAFAQFGKIVEVRIQRSKETARALSYGFIEFSEPICAETALNSMNNHVLKGRPLRYINHPTPLCGTFCKFAITNRHFANGAITAELGGPQSAAIQSDQLSSTTLWPPCTCDF